MPWPRRYPCRRVNAVIAPWPKAPMPSQTWLMAVMPFRPHMRLLVFHRNTGGVGRPPGGKPPEVPNRGAPAVGVEAGPDHVGQAARDKAGKRVRDQGDTGRAGLCQGRRPRRFTLGPARPVSVRGDALYRGPGAVGGGAETVNRRHLQQPLNGIADDSLRHHVGGQRNWGISYTLQSVAGEPAHDKAQERNLD